MKFFLSTAALALAGMAAVTNAHTYTFDDKPNGYLIDGTLGELGPFQVYGKSGEELRIYNTSLLGGADGDLELGVRNGIIIQNEDFDGADFAGPDDEMSGGTIVFEFTPPVTVKAMGFVDTERFPLIKFFGPSATLPLPQIGPQVQGIKTGDTAQGTKVFDHMGPDGVIGVKKMEVKFRTSGAINHIEVAAPGCTAYTFEGVPNGYLLTGAVGEFGPFAITEADGAELRIYDTTPPAGFDEDLTMGVANAVIIQANEPGAGIPNDDEHGGAIIFDFACPLEVKSITMVDTEVDHWVKFFGPPGAGLIATVPVPATGNKWVKTKTFAPGIASKLKIRLFESGAVSQVELCGICP